MPSAIYQKKDLHKVKLLKKEPIAMTNSEKKIVSELTGVRFPPVPGERIIYSPSPFSTKRTDSPDIRKYT